jgi:hypothetical protein
MDAELRVMDAHPEQVEELMERQQPNLARGQTVMGQIVFYEAFDLNPSTCDCPRVRQFGRARS